MYYGHLGTAVAGLEDTKKWPGILKCSQIILVKAEGFFVYPAVCQEETAHFPALKATVARCL